MAYNENRFMRSFCSYVSLLSPHTGQHDFYNVKTTINNGETEVRESEEATKKFSSAKYAFILFYMWGVIANRDMNSVIFSFFFSSFDFEKFSFFVVAAFIQTDSTYFSYSKCSILNHSFSSLF